MCTPYRRPDTPRTGCPLSRLATHRRYHRSFTAGLLVALSFIGLARAHTAAEAQALAERAVLYIHQVGREKAFADFSRRDGGFVDGELYVFYNTAEGVVLAHGGNPKPVGRNLTTVRDVQGSQPVAEVDRIALVRGQGWHDYVWPNPAAGLIQRKTSYVVRIDNNTVCGSGYYQPKPP
jgi:cytochrome c